MSPVFFYLRKKVKGHDLQLDLTVTLVPGNGTTGRETHLLSKRQSNVSIFIQLHYLVFLFTNHFLLLLLVYFFIQHLFI